MTVGTAAPKSIQLRDRVRLDYLERGDPSGIPVVLLHGITDSCRSFETVVSHLPESIRAFALSQRGHGDSERPESGYHPRDFAADVAAFLDAFDLGSAVVAGHSMGSHVARRFATDYPELARGLVLMGAFASMRANPVVVEFWESTVSTLTDPIDPEFVLEFQQSTLARPVPQAFLDTVVGESLKVPARVWRAALEGVLDDDFSEEQGTVAAPTLIVAGEQDLFAPLSDQDELAAAIAGSQLVMYSGAGHAFHREEPGRFAADLVAFVEERG